MLVSLVTLFVNAFVIYAFFTSKRSLQGTSLILLQVAFNDFISGKKMLISVAINAIKLSGFGLFYVLVETCYCITGNVLVPKQSLTSRIGGNY